MRGVEGLWRGWGWAGEGGGEGGGTGGWMDGGGGWWRVCVLTSLSTFAQHVEGCCCSQLSA